MGGHLGDTNFISARVMCVHMLHCSFLNYKALQYFLGQKMHYSNIYDPFSYLYMEEYFLININLKNIPTGFVLPYHS